MSMVRPHPLVAGNWKMNGNKSSIQVLNAIMEGYDSGLQSKVDLLICPPATLTMMFGEVVHGMGIAIGGQDCHVKVSGAHTGDIAATQLADAGAAYVIIGHSERRSGHGESDAIVCAKAIVAREAGLVPVVCIGETQVQREAGQALDIIRTQLDASLPETADGTDLVLAYEPVWAIGTGLTPTPEQIGEVHKVIRDVLVARYDSAGFMIRILYGGSVKPDNAASLLAVSNVDGALVGGASLVAKDFLGIAAFYR